MSALEPVLAHLRYWRASGLLPESKASGSVLDIGCGDGAFLRGYAQTYSRRVGLDPRPTRVLRSEFVQASAPPLPFDDRTFDVVVALAMIEHMSMVNGTALCREMHRALRPGGCCIITTPSPIGQSLLVPMARCGLVSREQIDQHECVWDLPSLLDVLRMAGFDSCHGGYFEFGCNIWVRAWRCSTG